MIFARLLLFLSLIAATTAGCVSLVTLDEATEGQPRGPSAPRILLPVPYVAQGFFTHDCGPAVAAMLLRYYRREGDREKIAGEIRRPDGTYATDLVRFLSGQGLTVSFQEEGTLEEIRRQLHLGNPSVVIQSTFTWPEGWPHYRVVIGYGPGYWVVHDSRFGAERCMREDDFLEAWQEPRTLLVVAGPAE